MDYHVSPSTFIDDVIAIVDSLTARFVENGFQALANHWVVGGLLTSILTLYILSFLYQAQFYNTPLFESILHLVKVVFVFLVATQWQVFYILIYNVATNEPLHILNLLLEVIGNPKGGLNDVFISGLKQAIDLLKHMPFSPKGIASTLLAAGSMIVATLLFTLVGVSIILISKMYLAVYLALAPFFLVLFLFNGTKGLSESWVKACLNNALVPVFVGCVFLFTTTIANACLHAGEMDVSNKTPDFIGILIYLATSLICAFLIKNVPEAVASLTSSLAIAGAGRMANYAKDLGTNVKKGASTVNRGANAAKNRLGKVQDHLKQRQAARRSQDEERRQRRARAGY